MKGSKVKPAEILLSASEIAGIVSRLGKQISQDYEGREPILVNLLKGGVVFLADLIRKITIPHRIEFMAVSSYDNETSSGVVSIKADLHVSIENRDVIIVEDVVDTGTTLAYIMEMLQLRAPRSIEVCSLLRKTNSNGSRVPVRYVGRDIPGVFVVGYGLDYNEKFRHLPHLARLEFPDKRN